MKKINNLIQRVLHHFLKQMKPHFMVIKETMIVDVDVVEYIYIYIYIYIDQWERTHNSYKRNIHFHQKRNHTKAKEYKNKGLQNKPTKNYESR
jgi:hypothetical protein